MRDGGFCVCPSWPSRPRSCGCSRRQCWVRRWLTDFVSMALSCCGVSMRVRVAVLCVYALLISSAVAEELGPDEAKVFVVGKMFAYSCFDGTEGMGRIFADGSVVGT